MYGVEPFPVGDAPHVEVLDGMWIPPPLVLSADNVGACIVVHVVPFHRRIMCYRQLAGNPS
jgi:hypothetical protein